MYNWTMPEEWLIAKVEEEATFSRSASLRNAKWNMADFLSRIHEKATKKVKQGDKTFKFKPGKRVVPMKDLPRILISQPRHVWSSSKSRRLRRRLAQSEERGAA